MLSKARILQRMRLEGPYARMIGKLSANNSTKFYVAMDTAKDGDYSAVMKFSVNRGKILVHSMTTTKH